LISLNALISIPKMDVWLRVHAVREWKYAKLVSPFYVMCVGVRSVWTHDTDFVISITLVGVATLVVKMVALDKLSYKH
jgi:hypothetical protein